MALIECIKCGQYYDADQTTCPYCGNPTPTQQYEIDNLKTQIHSSSEEIKTEMFMDEDTNKTEFDNNFSNRNVFNNSNQSNKNSSDKTTFIMNNKKTDKRAIVGWFVIIDGAGTGEDVKILIGQNSIGRSKTNTICIDFGDNAISREKHAYIVYDPKFNKFIFRNGEGQNLSYVNEQGVYTPIELKRGDIIEIGNTKLRFIPFCDEEFKWGNKK